MFVLAAALAIAPVQKAANRLLAATLVVIAGLLIPYAIGFAGAYDAWRGLTFAPFAIPLALGPLLFAYASALEENRVSRRLLWHFAPPLVQAAYFTICFLLPIGRKWAWYTGGHDAVVSPVFSALTLTSLAGYALAIGPVLKRYRARLADERSDDDQYAARWLSRVRAAIVFSLLVEVAFWLWSTATGGIDYFQETGLYLALGGLGLYLGVAGLRQAGLPPPLRALDRLPEPKAAPARAPTDWRLIAGEIADRTRAEGWWREPDLTLPGLARRLGTNSGRLSRAINLGLEVNFSVFINGLRAEAVADAITIRPKADLLDLAFEMGFASKASFNRAFHARYGMAPSAYRRQVSNPDFSPLMPDLRRADA
ncbi:AraC family transcriptional regulator [Brevundimonas goettingensis]|uniref:AraC family transcriptional regulator n=1 Tax=Brevundimonas goettingensis TaxID=2774190 RepID=A0A975C1L7_9CAUL|nr:AraC family transcriptional regulator [Brevundimonas goettingensis]